MPVAALGRSPPAVRTAAAGNVRCVSEIARCWPAVHQSAWVAVSRRRRRHLPAAADIGGMRVQRDGGVLLQAVTRGNG